MQKKDRSDPVLAQVLERVAAQAIPEDTDLWPRILEGAQKKVRQPGARPRLPRSWLAWAPVALALLLLLLGTISYAANSSSVLRDLFWPHAGKGDRATQLHLSQTVGEVTVNLELAYADSNEVLLGLSVSGPEQDRYWFSPGPGGGLWTKDGVLLPGVSGFGVGREGDAFGGWQPSERLAEVMSFDSSVIEGAPAQLDLHFETNVGSGDRGPGQGAIVGPFVFDFKVPFRHARDIVIPVDQTVEADGIAIRLDKVTITATQVQALIWTDGASGRRTTNLPPTPRDFPTTYGYWMLTPPGSWTWDTPPPVGNGTTLGDSGMTRIWFRKKDLPMDRSGEWTLTRQQWEQQSPGGQPSKGPSWVFKFQVP